MAMFGNRPIFDQNQRFGGGVGADGTMSFNGPHQPDLGDFVRPTSPIPTPEGNNGFFSKNGGWRDVVGALGDAVATAGGGQGVYLPQKVQQRQMEMVQKQREVDRKAALEDWVWKAQYEAAHPKPTFNDTVADFNFIAQQIGPDAAKAYLQNKTLPPPFVQRNSDGTSTIYPQGLPRGDAPEPTLPAIGTVMPDPRKAGGAGSGPRPFP